MKYLFDIFLGVMIAVIAHRINKWLDSKDQKGSYPHADLASRSTKKEKSQLGCPRLTLFGYSFEISICICRISCLSSFFNSVSLNLFKSMRGFLMTNEASSLEAAGLNNSLPDYRIMTKSDVWTTGALIEIKRVPLKLISKGLRRENRTVL